MVAVLKTFSPPPRDMLFHLLTPPVQQCHLGPIVEQSIGATVLLVGPDDRAHCGVPLVQGLGDGAEWPLVHDVLVDDVEALLVGHYLVAQVLRGAMMPKLVHGFGLIFADRLALGFYRDILLSIGFDFAFTYLFRKFNSPDPFLFLIGRIEAEYLIHFW